MSREIRHVLRINEEKPMTSILAGIAIITGLLTACFGVTAAPEQLGWTPQVSGVDLNLRGLAVVDANIVWIGSPQGTVLRTVNGGKTWTHTRIPAAASLDLRSVHAFDDQHALFFTAGSPAQLFVTFDGAQSFKLVYEDVSAAAFFDSLEFWDDQRGLAFSDPVDGQFHILLTSDGGQSWRPVDKVPHPLIGEAGFAASDTSIAVAPGGLAWIGTGGGLTARVLHTLDWGKSWVVYDTPLAAGTREAGVFSVVFNQRYLIAVGGNHTKADEGLLAAAWSFDQGKSWTIPAGGVSGFRSAVAAIPSKAGHLIAVGTNGVDMSYDHGDNWFRSSDTGFNAIAFSSDGTVGWAVGSEGRISQIDVLKP